MKLNTILRCLTDSGLYKKIVSKEKNFDDIDITGSLKTNAQQVKTGDVFVCIPGTKVDGHSFAKEALDKGATLIVAQRPLHELPQSAIQIVVKDARKATAIIARLYFDDPSKKFLLIGVTGTNGKTTTTHILEQFFQRLGIQTGLIGTLGYKIGDREFPTERTTPDIVELHEIFNQMVVAGCQIVIMEVSSHALSLHRVYGLTFRVRVFTNLSPDHLDFHKDMEDYFHAKKMLFDYPQNPDTTSIINISDRYGKRLYTTTTGKKIALDTKKRNPKHHIDPASHFHITNVKLHADGTAFTMIDGDGVSYSISTHLTGLFNAQNLFTALATVKECCPKVDFHQIISLVPQIKSAPGRMEKVKNDVDTNIYVDYAHTPDALQNILDTARGFTKKRLICVFGCGGDRDRTKRSLMGQIAIQKADLTIITTDNPRNEHPADIIRDIVATLDYSDHYFIIRDRELAIRSAILLAHSSDTVIIAGKGHETYQEIGNTKYCFDDKEASLRAVEYKKSYTQVPEKLAIPYDILNIEKYTGQCISNEVLSNFSAIFETISTDSRSIDKKSLFIALVGEKYDGADFVSQVMEKSQDNLCIVNSSSATPQKCSSHIIKVDDTLKLYGSIAQKYIKLFSTKNIAITGSTGKTTTKEICYNVLSTIHNVYKTVANENNQVGLPKNILKLQPYHECAIFEIGTNAQGEIGYLSDIIQPHISLIISINSCHLDGLGKLDYIYKEKLSLLSHTHQIAIIPHLKPVHKKYIKSPKKLSIYTFGNDQAASFHVKSTMKKKGLHLSIIPNLSLDNPIPFIKKCRTYNTNISVPFYADNAALAVILAKILYTDDKNILQGLRTPLSIQNRMDVVKKSRQTIIFDCYNANPSSMSAAIDYWASISPNRPHLAILGEMKELGDKAIYFHKKIATELNKLKKKYPRTKFYIIGVSELTQHISPDIYYPTVDELIDSHTLKIIPSNAVILVKGSNSINLQKVKGVL
jgi:UDP-N-acetylmuramyl-tripeptide synthetase/UDP-N-acetylmuramoyl-tripeptide--D-alanyl-D-alanine ligase